jgi:predicted membrane-bound spermidine synthase
LVDVPMSFFEKDKKIKVLLLGGGDFIPSRFFKKFDANIAKIDMVDLDPDFRDFAKKELKDFNQGA